MLCACGCGRTTTVYRGKERRYVRGHGATPPRRDISESDYSVEDRGYETPCWIWKRMVDPDGYAVARFGGRRRRVQRVVYEIRVGPIPGGSDIHHLCEQRSCVNFGHLLPLPRRTHGRLQSRLTPAEVEEIRESADSQRKLAMRFRVGRTTIQRIQTREHWN